MFEKLEIYPYLIDQLLLDVEKDKVDKIKGYLEQIYKGYAALKEENHELKNALRGNKKLTLQDDYDDFLLYQEENPTHCGTCAWLREITFYNDMIKKGYKEVDIEKFINVKWLRKMYPERLLQ